MADVRKTISDIKKLPVDDKFSSIGVILDIHEKKDKNGRSYWILSLMDKSGSMEAKVWANSQWWDYRDGDKKEIVKPEESSLVANLKGTTVGVTGQVSQFRGKNQYNYNQIFVVNQDKDEYRPESFVQAAPIDFEELEGRFDSLMGRCEGDLQDFMAFVFNKDGHIWKEFKVMPAAVSHHHAYVHGLLEHSVSVTELALSMADSLKGNVIPDKSLVIAGGLLHDLGKLDSYTLNPGPGMTVQGTVIDHIALGYSRFETLAVQFGLKEDLRYALGHIILSHHGKKEYGSPVLPATAEALLVSTADELDFKLFCWYDSVSELEGGLENPEHSVSDVNYSAQRRFWKWRPEGENN